MDGASIGSISAGALGPASGPSRRGRSQPLLDQPWFQKSASGRVTATSCSNCGDSAAIDFLGHPLSEATDEEVVSTMLLQAAPLVEHRAKFPALLDGDRFRLED